MKSGPTRSRSLHEEEQRHVDASLTQRAISWRIYLFAVIAGLAIGFFLRSLNRYVYSSAIPSTNIEGPLILIAPAISYAIVGGAFGYIWPQNGLKWGIWISAIPWLYVAVVIFPLIREPHSNTLGLFLFSNLVLGPIAASLGSHLGARLSSKKHGPNDEGAR